MNILEKIASYCNEKSTRKNEVLEECKSLSSEIFRILRSKYPYLGDIKIMNFGWNFQVQVKYKDGLGWNTYTFPSEEIEEEFEEYPQIISFNKKVKDYSEWDSEKDNSLYHEIRENYQWFNRFLYSQGYQYNISNYIYQGDRYIIFCTNGNDYVTIDCIEKKIINIQSYKDFQAEMLEEKLESFKRVEALLKK